MMERFFQIRQMMVLFMKKRLGEGDPDGRLNGSNPLTDCYSLYSVVYVSDCSVCFPTYLILLITVFIYIFINVNNESLILYMCAKSAMYHQNYCYCY